MIQQILNTSVLVLFIAVPVLAGLFSFWSNSKRDGFDPEKVFDLAIFGLAGGGMLSLLILIIISRALLPINLPNLNPYAFVFGFVLTMCFVVLKWKWSIYRVLDNFAVSLTLMIAFWLLTQGQSAGFKPLYLLVAVLLFVIYYLLQRYRLLVIKSGLTFCLVSGIFCVAGGLSSPQIFGLIFIMLLFTLTLLVLIFRLRSLYVRTEKTGGAPSNA